MYIQERMYSHFLDLVENKKFAKRYFRNRNISEFNNQTLEELKECLKKADFRYNKMLLLLSIVQFLDSERLITKVTLKTEVANKALKKCITDLDIFQENLAFLIISNVIKLEDCGSLGFDSEYIKELMYAYKKQIKNPYVEYYYDEKTGRTARVDKCGKMLILPYTPIAVKNKLNEQRANGNGGRSRFRSEI